MLTRPLTAVAVLTCMATICPALAQPSVTPKFSRSIPNIPGKSLIVVEVSHEPGGRSTAHRHAGSAFIYGYVLSVTIRTQVEGGPVQTLKAGESFYEAPGAHHLLDENASKTESAKFLAVFVVDTKDKTLTTPDK